MKKLVITFVVILISLAFSMPVLSIQYPDPEIEIDGINFSNSSGGWEVEGTSVFNYSVGWVQYEAVLEAGSWYNIGLNAINHSYGLPLPPGYSNYEIELSFGPGEDIPFYVPASLDEIHYGYTPVLIETAGLIPFRFNWVNDEYAENQYDANLKITSVFLDPFLPNQVPEPSTVLLLSIGLVGLLAVGRKKMKQ